MTEIEEQLQYEIIQTTNAQLLPQASLTLFKQKLALYINNLINRDFEKLIYILYRVDISEKKLKKALASSSADAGIFIAEMIIERQMQKVKMRSQYSGENKNISDEEKW
jgi:hypothetical protein